MLDKCSEIAEVISLEFNVEKSYCIVIGTKRTSQITPMSLCGNPVEWCETIKYLGVYLQGDRQVSELNACWNNVIPT